MKDVYETTELTVTAFDVEDVITTSGVTGGAEDGISHQGGDAPFGF